MFYISDYFYFAGFAFVYFEDERDADDAIRGLDNLPFGHDRRRLSVEWARVDFSPSLPFFGSMHLSSLFIFSSGKIFLSFNICQSISDINFSFCALVELG